MNSEMQKRLYEMEVMPPAAVWEKLSLNIDEINADNVISMRIFNTESAPPSPVWEKLALDVDEINQDNRIAKKILNAELTPPVSVWGRIDSSINLVEEEQAPRRAIVINLKRLAVAAVFIGLAASAWLLFSNNNKQTELAGTDNTNRQTPPNTNTPQKKDSKILDSPVDAATLQRLNVVPGSREVIAPVSRNSNQVKSRNYGGSSRNKKNVSVEPATAQYAVLNTPSNKNFDKPIDDLSLVSSDQNYLTMVNANGRLVKIPAQFASLAPHLQDKPIAEDYNEIMFGEGTYWKETLDEWRKKIVTAPVVSGDAFTSLVELLKNVQNK